MNYDQTVPEGEGRPCKLDDESWGARVHLDTNEGDLIKIVTREGKRWTMIVGEVEDLMLEYKTVQTHQIPPLEADLRDPLIDQHTLKEEPFYHADIQRAFAHLSRYSEYDYQHAGVAALDLDDREEY